MINILTIWEEDAPPTPDGGTRIAIPVDAVAFDMMRYFREDLKLRVQLVRSVENPITDVDELEHGQLYLNEWRTCNPNRLTVK
jgi:hypothetical protein